MKNNKIANNSTITKAREKNKHRFGIHRILEINDVRLTNYKGLFTCPISEHNFALS